MQKYLEKAEVLIEALPYIQRFNRKIIVVKYGGSAMVDEELKRHVIEDVTLLKLCGFKPIIVHGGGKEISKWVGKVGKEPQFINGLRVTDEETMEIAEMVLGRVNKSLVQLVESLGVRAIGISGKDGELLKVEKKLSNGEDIGFVGDVKQVNAQILYDLLEKDFLPIICPIGMDDDYNTYNINADDAACAIARAMQVEKLAFLTDIEGVYKDPKDPSTLISELEVEEAKHLIGDGYIGGGMLPKLQNCIDAIESGVSRVHIIDGRIPHCLLLEIFTNKGIGTAILSKKVGITMVNSKIQAAEENLIHVYNRFPIALDHGEGMYLYDTEGKEYLDFAAGFAVSGLGYDNKELNQALKDQIDKLYHTSNLYYHESCGEAAQELNRISGMDRVFFTNSGGEANEGALKAARRYAYTKKTGRYEFIAMNNSFHGRSFGAVSVTGHDSYREPFEPVVPGVKFATFNDLDSVKALVSDKTCAIILEPLQGEGGINLATQEFMEGIRKICDENGILMICDEVQCGMGRTGSMFAWQGFGVKPDILTMAKAIGNGIPVGAFAMTEEVAKYSLQPGDHGATYGGNPLACTAVKTVIKIFERDHIVDHVNAVAPYLTKRLDELVEELDCVTERKGKGLMQGIVVTKPLAEVNKRAIEEGILIIQAQGNVIRFVPPLIVEEKHIDEMIEKLKRALA